MHAFESDPTILDVAVFTEANISLYVNVMFFLVSGQFEVVSATVNHYRGGMRANYTVTKCSIFQRQSEIMLHSKTYYIAAVEVDWDYSPNRTWEAEMFRGQQRYSTICTPCLFEILRGNQQD